MKRKIPIVILSLLVFSLSLGLTVSAFASDEAVSGQCGDDARWDLGGYQGNWLTISGTGAIFDYLSPSMTPNNPWTEVQEDGEILGKNITLLFVEEGITRIGKGAFGGIPHLLQVTLPETLEVIDDYAFAGDPDLHAVGVPASVKYISNLAFPENLNAINFDGTRAQWDAIRQPGTDEPFVTSAKVLILNRGGGDTPTLTPTPTPTPAPTPELPVPPSDKAFTIDEKGVLKKYTGPGGDVTIPDGVRGIAKGAFWDCATVTSISIPASVTSIADLPLRRCSALTWIGVREGNPKYYNINGVLFDRDGTLVAYPTARQGAYEIPRGVTKIAAGAFVDCEGLTAVTIPEGVKSIGGSAFSCCTSLTDVTIPEGVTSIGSSAFSNCSSMTGVTIPSSLKSVGAQAFSSYSLTRVDISDLAAWCGISFDGWYANPVYYAKRLYLNGQELTGEVVIPEGVKAVKAYAFEEIVSPLTFRFPDSITYIGSYAFYNCKGLTGALTLPEGVTSIGQYAFYKCEGLTGALTLPERLTQLSRGAFEKCTALTAVALPSSLKSVGVYAFCSCSALTGVTLPEGLETIGGNAFSGCGRLTEIRIPDSVTSLGANAFSGCKALTSATLPTGLTEIKGSLFYDCAALTDIAIPDSLTSIGENAFRGCALTDIRIPDSVMTIGSYAFSGCASLRSATLPAGLTAIPDDLFYGCAALTEVRIPDTVTSIGINAFGGTGLTDVTIPNGVTELTSCEFKDCVRLARVRLPDSLTVLRGGAFSGCKALEEITIPSGLTEVGGGAFSDCTGLTTLRVRAGVQAIGASAFSNCSSLKTMYIPDSVTKIGKDAFTDCDALTDVYYSGSAAQWAAIDIDRTVYERRVDSGGPQLAPHLRTYAPFVSNTQLLRAAVHYNSDISYAVSDPVRVTVRGIAVQWTDAEPFIDANRRTMVPLRAVAEALGLSVSWVSEGRYARFTDGSRAISFPIGKTVAYSSEGDIPIDTAAVILSGRTYAPIRYLAEYFGYTVGWYGATRTVTIG